MIYFIFFISVIFAVLMASCRVIIFEKNRVIIEFLWKYRLIYLVNEYTGKCSISIWSRGPGYNENDDELIKKSGK